MAVHRAAPTVSMARPGLPGWMTTTEATGALSCRAVPLLHGRRSATTALGRLGPDLQTFPRARQHSLGRGDFRPGSDSALSESTSDAALFDLGQPLLRQEPELGA
jgi:hypothetical protein